MLALTRPQTVDLFWNPVALAKRQPLKIHTQEAECKECLEGPLCV